MFYLSTNCHVYRSRCFNPYAKKIQFILNLVIITLHNRWRWWLPRKLLSKPQVLKTLNDISMSKITTFVHFDPIPWLGVTFTFPSLCRAATLVRRTKGENRRGRSHPLRCGRQRWYGGTRGGDTGGVSGEAAPHAVTTPGHHTLHIPPPHTHLVTTFLFFLISFYLFSLPHLHQLFTSCYGGLTCACLCWLNSQTNITDSFWFFLLNCMTWVQRDGPTKDNKMKPRSKQTTESLQAVLFQNRHFKISYASIFLSRGLIEEDVVICIRPLYCIC